MIVSLVVLAMTPAMLEEDRTGRGGGTMGTKSRFLSAKLRSNELRRSLWERL